MAGVNRQYGEPYQYGSEEKRMERLIFNHRPIWLVIIAILNCYFKFEMMRIKIHARFEKMLPRQHEFLQNMFSRLDDLTQKGLSFKIVIENTQSDIFDKEYLQVLQGIHDQVFNINGIDR